MDKPDQTQRLAYAARISQKLSGPSEAIIGFVGLLTDELERSGPASILEDLAKVQSAAARLGDMISKLSSDPRDIAADAELQARLRHDLRTPINAIIGYLEMMSEDFEDEIAPSAVRDIVSILRESRLLANRIDEVVDGAQPAEAETDDRQEAEIAAGLAQSLSADRRNDGALTGHILVIDDEAPNREILKRQLERKGHTVKTVSSARETFEALAKDRFHLILLDILMPDTNGIETLERIKADPETSEIPCVMVSGLKETDAIARCISSGAEDYLPKPIDPVLLHARVDACLERLQWRARERAFTKEIKYEKDRADALLQSMLPAPVIIRLNNGETEIVDRFDCATIVFADIVDFTPLVSRIDARDLVKELSRIFTAFDELASIHSIEKIKTIGDAYMAASGIPAHRKDHAQAAIRFSRDMLKAMSDSAVSTAGLKIRVGVHSGPVIAGLIGRTRSIYDVWGETVNLASRLETSGRAGKIHISGATKQELGDELLFASEHVHEAKGIGKLVSYFID